MFRHLMLAFTLIATTALGICAMEHTSDPLDQVKAAVEAGKAVMLDVREQGEWDAGHLAKAQLIPLSALSKDVATLAAGLPKDKPIYIHCKAGGRCLAAAELLKPLGYDVRPLKAGFGELVKNGFTPAEPTKTGPATK